MFVKRVIIRIQSEIANSNFQIRNFSKSSPALLNQGWRQRHRLTRNPNIFGPLTNLPDYSFKDGKPAPFGVKQMIRINKQRAYFDKIKVLTDQIDNAVENHKLLEEEKAKERQLILDRKLKPKGHLLENV